MLRTISDLSPAPAGFGKCGQCAYLEAGTAEICFLCAKNTFEPLSAARCGVCQLGGEPDEDCGNPLCRWEDRYFDSCMAISMLTGVLEKAVYRYKKDGKRAWALIFGRVVAGYVERNADEIEQYDLIIPAPTYLGPGASREWDHIRLIVEAAARETETSWPFDLSSPGTVIKTAETKRLKDCKSWQERHAVATGALRAALNVPYPYVVRGKRILLFDDVFTGGLTMNEVARALVLAGAESVTGLVLARAPFKKRKAPAA